MNQRTINSAKKRAKIEEFTRQVDEWRQRLGPSLNEGASLAPGLDRDRAEELSTAFEELQVAEEELRVQSEELALSQEELEVERRRYQDLFEFAPDAYLVLALDGVILQANRAASQLLGVRAESLVRKPFQIFIPLVERQIFRLLLRSWQENELEGEWELHLQPRHRPPVEASFSAACIRNSDGIPTGFRLLVRDTGERRRAEQAQRRAALAENAYRLLTSSLEGKRLVEQALLIAVPGLADLCMVHLRTEEGAIGETFLSYRDPKLARRLLEYERRSPIDPGSSHPVAAVLRTGKRVFRTHLTSESLHALARSPEHLALLNEIGMQSFVSLPLRAQGRMRGVISFGGAARRLGKTVERERLDTLARQLALALDNAALYAETRDERDRVRQEVSRGAAALQSCLDSVTDTISGLEPTGSPGSDVSGTDSASALVEVKVGLAQARRIIVQLTESLRTADTAGTAVEKDPR